MERRLDAGLGESSCVRLAGVAEHVVLGGDDVCRSDTGEVGREQR
jgi:hypothetical protein